MPYLEYMITEKLNGREFNYSDVIVLQNKLTDFGVEDIDLTTQLSKNIKIKIPIISSPMDTVTEADMAIAMALQGGLGVIHYNMSPEEQAKQAERVKRFESGFIENPVTVSPETSISEVSEIRKKKGISTVPVTENGKPNGKIVGIITKDDYSLQRHESLKVKDRMTLLKNLLVAKWSELSKETDPLEKANSILLESHRGTLPIIDDFGNLIYLVTRPDIEKNEVYPYASKDQEKKLRVAVAVESYLDKARARAEATHKFADAFIIDTSHGFTSFVKQVIQELHEKYPGKDVIAGNVSTAEATKFLIEAGADAVKIGTGPGSICTTTKQLGVGRLQGSAIYECAEMARKLAPQYGYIPIIADGGIREFGDFLKALALGADSVMVGYMLAGTKETPGEFEDENGKLVKKYRGMGSEEAMKAGSAVRYGTQGLKIRVPEGVVMKIEYKGGVHEIIPRYAMALRQGMQKTGCKTIEELHNKALIAPRTLII